MYIVEKECLNLEYIGDSMLPNSCSRDKFLGRMRARICRAHGTQQNSSKPQIDKCGNDFHKVTTNC